MPDENQIGAQPETGDRNITFTRAYSVAQPRDELAYMVTASDWDRIKKMIARIVPAKKWFEIDGSICVGIFVTAVFSSIGFAVSKDVPTWAKLVSWTATICAAILAGGLFFLDAQQRADLVRSTSEVTEEMKRLETAPRPEVPN